MNRTLDEMHPSLPTCERRRQLREMAGLSRSKLAALVGVSPESIYKWENGGEPQGLHRRAYAAMLAELGDATGSEEAGGWPNDS